MDYEKRFLFHGHAVAAQALIRRHEDKLVEGPPPVFPGAVALTSEGGYAESKSGRQEYTTPLGMFVLAFESAYAFVSGDYTDAQKAFERTQGLRLDEDLPVRTESAANVTELDVLHRFKAKTLSTSHVADQLGKGAPRFRIKEQPLFENLTVDDFPLEVDMDLHLLAFATKEELAREYEHNETFRNEYAERFYRPKGLSNRLFPRRAPEVDGKFVISFVKGLRFPRGTPPGAEIEGNQLTLPNFGKIHFGELIIWDDARRVKLLRMNLGSPCGGHANFIQCEVNGTPWPP